MKTITKVSLLSAALAAAVPFAFAAAPSGPGPDAPAVHAPGKVAHRSQALRHRRLSPRRVAHRLHLSQDQVAKLRTIRSSTRAAVVAVRRNAALDDAQRHAQIRDLRMAARQQMDSVLGPGQRAKLARIRAKLQERLNRQLGGF